MVSDCETAGIIGTSKIRICKHESVYLLITLLKPMGKWLVAYRKWPGTLTCTQLFTRATWQILYYTFRLDDHVMSQQSYFPEPFLKGTKEVHTVILVILFSWNTGPGPLRWLLKYGDLYAESPCAKQCFVSGFLSLTHLDQGTFRSTVLFFVPLTDLIREKQKRQEVRGPALWGVGSAL